MLQVILTNAQDIERDHAIMKLLGIAIVVLFILYQLTKPKTHGGCVEAINLLLFVPMFICIVSVVNILLKRTLSEKLGGMYYFLVLVCSFIAYYILKPSRKTVEAKTQKRIIDLTKKLYLNTPYVSTMANAVFSIDRSYGNVYQVEVGTNGMNIFYGNNSVTTVPFASIGLRDLEKSTRKNPHVQACAFALAGALGSGWGIDYTYGKKGDFYGTAMITRNQENLTAPGRRK